MDIFELKRIADKILMKFPWEKGHGNISINILPDGLYVSGSNDAITIIINSSILTEEEKNLVVYDIDDLVS